MQLAHAGPCLILGLSRGAQRVLAARIRTGMVGASTRAKKVNSCENRRLNPKFDDQPTQLLRPPLTFSGRRRRRGVSDPLCSRGSLSPE